MNDPKEHSGGLTTIGVEFADETSFKVPIQQFDFDALDTLTDQCLQLLLDGKPIEPLVAAHVAAQRFAFVSEGVNLVLAEIIPSRKPRLAACQLMFAFDLAVSMGVTGPKQADLVGISKEAFFQGVEKYRQRYGGKLRVSNQRDPKARAKMRLRNHRHNENQIKRAA